MAWTVDLGPLVRVQKQLWRGAFFTGLGVYLEGLLAFVLATEQSLSLAAVVIIIAILVAQLALIYHPAKLLLRGRLSRTYRIHLVLMVGFALVLSLGSPAGDARIGATVMATLVAAMTVWAAVALIRTAGVLRPQLRHVRDETVLMESLSFNVSDSIATRLRVFGGDRRRWIVPAVGAVVAFVGVVLTLSVLLRAIGLRPAS